MKLGNGILKTSIQNVSYENFHFYNSLVLTDDLAFQRTHFRITPPNIPRLYQHDAASDDHDDLPLQNQSSLQNSELLKIAILTSTNACKRETSHAIIDYGASCCVTPYIENFLHQPTSIQNTTLTGIAGGLTDPRQRNRTTQNTPIKQRKHNLDRRQRNIRTRMPHLPNQPTTITHTIENKKT
jgi:hypothetical protein